MKRGCQVRPPGEGGEPGASACDEEEEEDGPLTRRRRREQLPGLEGEGKRAGGLEGRALEAASEG